MKKQVADALNEIAWKHEDFSNWKGSPKCSKPVFRIYNAPEDGGYFVAEFSRGKMLYLAGPWLTLSEAKKAARENLRHSQPWAQTKVVKPIRHAGPSIRLGGKTVAKRARKAK